MPANNPYKFNGPLDPENDKQVCISRKEDLERVISGVMKGDYWAILGPRQIGKTTFLRQVKNTFRNAHFIYFNFEEAPTDKDDFYRWIKNRLETEIPSEQTKFSFRWWGTTPEFKFFQFLEKFAPGAEKRIVLMFDDIGGISFAGDFLRNWRRVYHERNHKKELDRYRVIITGAVDLIELTQGPTSPFNIAKTIFIRDFSMEESKKLIDEPFKKLNIRIDPDAEQNLISYLSGHPQLLQHLCYLLVQKGVTPNQAITWKEVKSTIEFLKVTNSILAMLKENTKSNTRLAKLIRDILNGHSKKYYPYKEFYFLGAGAIVNRDSLCSIRNKLFEDVIGENLEKNNNLSHPQKSD
ncbi:MAG: AAA family ATPase [Candidatus Aminicenantes bacterium]|nr:AAA family ATPase [Candidatus Aminicenantes bacterium]